MTNSATFQLVSPDQAPAPIRVLNFANHWADTVANYRGLQATNTPRERLVQFPSIGTCLYPIVKELSYIGLLDMSAKPADGSLVAVKYGPTTINFLRVMFSSGNVETFGIKIYRIIEGTEFLICNQGLVPLADNRILGVVVDRSPLAEFLPVSRP